MHLYYREVKERRESSFFVGMPPEHQEYMPRRAIEGAEGKDMGGMYDSWHNADAALKYWAKRMRFVLCTGSGRKDCVKP